MNVEGHPVLSVHCGVAVLTITIRLISCLFVPLNPFCKLTYRRYWTRTEWSLIRKKLKLREKGGLSIVAIVKILQKKIRKKRKSTAQIDLHFFTPTQKLNNYATVSNQLCLAHRTKPEVLRRIWSLRWNVNGLRERTLSAAMQVRCDVLTSSCFIFCRTFFFFFFSCFALFSF